jgi:glycerol-3-phosphate acyltransferase PlsY
MTTRELVLIVLLPVAAYLVASTPVGVLIAAAKGVNLRQHGSGNVGATNVGRVVGRKWGYVCFLLDVAKGLLPVLAAGLYVRGDGVLTGAEQAAWLLTALGAVLGHVLSFWLGFRGGKGVATSLGVVLGFWPYFTVPGLAAFAVWILVTLRWRYVSLGSVVAALAFPVFFAVAVLVRGWPLMQMLPFAALALAVAALIVIRHRSNVRRLLAHTENKIRS